MHGDVCHIAHAQGVICACTQLVLAAGQHLALFAGDGLRGLGLFLHRTGQPQGCVLGAEVVARQCAGARDFHNPAAVFLAQARLAAVVVGLFGADGQRHAGAVAQVNFARELLAGVVGVKVHTTAWDQVLVGGVVNRHIQSLCVMVTADR